MWVKLITHTGYVKNVDWKRVYVDLRAKADIYYPGKSTRLIIFIHELI